jgi:hypothetical protein
MIQRVHEPMYEDVETCGRYGMIVLIQTAIGNGPIELFTPWNNKVSETLTLIRKMVYHQGGIVGFNLAFDWFHICKMYCTFKLLYEKYGDVYPEDFVDEIGVLEAEARDGECLRPVKALDLMLHARKGPYQALMAREDIRIKRVPTVLAYELAKELGQRVQIKDIFFARQKDKTLDKWRVYDCKNGHGEYDPEFKDIVCKFSPSTALKALAVDALGVKEDEVLKFIDVECKEYPEEVGWAPYALAMGGGPGNWKDAWPDKIRFHITHWGYNETARRYATNDIVYTRGLDHNFGLPHIGDVDSELACMVATIRWRGYRIDIEGVKQLRLDAIGKSKEFPRASRQVQQYIGEMMNEEEKLTIRDSTKKIILEEISEWLQDDGVTVHPAAIRAQNVLDARKSEKEVELYDKLLQAGRFHASFVVIGTKSSRMAGTDGLNPQGINHTKRVRGKFLFAWFGQTLSGGDFSAFEVSLAAAVYNDTKLIEDLKSGKKFAGLIGQSLFPDLDYDDILESEGEEEDFYDKSKRAGFAWIYGGNEATWKSRIGIDEDIGREAIKHIEKRYPGIAIARRRIEQMFCSMRQPGGIGTKVEWHEPADYIESKLGDRRYYTLENRICRALFDLAHKPPKHWMEFKIQVTRRDRVQTAYGALQSALYAAAFNIQASNLRSAANHEIQAFGARITKEVQYEVWSFQPIGICEWFVMPFNCHDELETPHKPELGVPIKEKVLAKIETYREKVPLIKMGWDIGLIGWKGKG